MSTSSIQNNIKGTVHQKMKICGLFTHPQAIQDINEFACSSEKIWKKFTLHHLLTSGSSAVNGCRQNESLINASQ